MNVYKANIENGIVTNIIITADNYEPETNGFWVNFTRESGNINIGYTYALEEGFRPPKPYNSWIWNETGKYWEAPVPLPDEENIYEWNNDTESWKLMYIKYVQ